MVISDIFSDDVQKTMVFSHEHIEGGSGVTEAMSSSTPLVSQLQLTFLGHRGNILLALAYLDRQWTPKMVRVKHHRAPESLHSCFIPQIVSVYIMYL